MRADDSKAELGGPILSGEAWSRVRHNGQLVRDEVTAGLPSMLQPAAWQQFRQMPIARSACWLLSLLEPPDDAGLYRRRSRPASSGLFDDIPSLAHRERAEKVYANLCERHSERLATCPWLLPILAGRARDLAVRPEAHGSEQGRRMRRIKGGKHVQQRYRQQGWHPLPSVRKAWGLSADRPHHDPAPTLRPP